MGKVKFSYGTEFQQEILHYIVKDKNGIIGLKQIKDSYFTLISHQVIAKALSKFAKKNKKVPKNPAVLMQEVEDILNVKSLADLVTKDDLVEVKHIINSIYNTPVTDSETIAEKMIKFAVFVQMKDLNDNFDLSDFSQYEEYSKQISKILAKTQAKKETSLYLVKDVIDRQLIRQADPQVMPTPFRQLNQLANGGGFPKGSILVALDKSKATKTFTLVNVARSYMKLQKVVLYIDMENGAREIMMRMEQSTLNRTKEELLSGDHDKLEQKHLRKYKRLGSEFIVRKLPANVGTANDIAEIIDDVYNESGLRVNVLIIDFMGKMGSIGKHEDDFNRISNVYNEVSNLAVEKDIDIVWTAQHVTRQAEIRRETRYEESDIAKCLDISRTASFVFGLNSTQEEREHGVQRWETVVARDAPSWGRCLFNIDLEKQRFQEFTVSQRKAYDENVAPKIDEQLKSNNTFKKRDKPKADPEKMKQAKDI